jgi:hypothetical protein
VRGNPAAGLSAELPMTVQTLLQFAIALYASFRRCPVVSRLLDEDLSMLQQ